MENVKRIQRVLLLSADTGGGHNACARAMAEYLDEQGIRAEVRDGLSFVSRGYSRFLSKGHSLVYRFLPGGFDVGWRYCERHPRMFERGSATFRKLASGVDRLYRAVLDGGYDAVISTHGLTAVMISELQRRYRLPVRTAFIATDHTNYPCMHMTDLDLYLVPDEAECAAYERSGIPRERMIIGGIPVRRGFGHAPDRYSARCTLGMDEGERNLLVMGGSMGCGPLRGIVSRVLEGAPEEVGVTVICGRNRRLYRSMRRRYRGNKRVRVLDYCEDVPLYMAATDVFLTKPGGISTAEASSMALPMVLVNMVAGCEQSNLDYFLRIGGAVTASGRAEVAALCRALLEEDDRRAGMREALHESAPPDGAAVLWETLCSASRDRYYMEDLTDEKHTAPDTPRRGGLSKISLP